MPPLHVWRARKRILNGQHAGPRLQMHAQPSAHKDQLDREYSAGSHRKGCAANEVQDQTR